MDDAGEIMVTDHPRLVAIQNHPGSSSCCSAATATPRLAHGWAAARSRAAAKWSILRTFLTMVVLNVLYFPVGIPFRICALQALPRQRELGQPTTSCSTPRSVAQGVAGDADPRGADQRYFDEASQIDLAIGPLLAEILKTMILCRTRSTSGSPDLQGSVARHGDEGIDFSSVASPRVSGRRRPAFQSRGIVFLVTQQRRCEPRR